MTKVPEIRIRAVNAAPRRAGGDYVLYWMIANRRLQHNFSLDRALELCREHAKPLFVFEALRIGYRWASDRIHRFVLDGMADNEADCSEAGVRYYPYVEPIDDADKGLLEALAERACAVVTDDFPCFFLPRMVASAGKRLDVSLEAVDSNGLFPLRGTDQVSGRAFDFRRLLQKELPKHLDSVPAVNPLRNYDLGMAPLPQKVAKNWPRVSRQVVNGDARELRPFAIDHAATPAETKGGTVAARERLRHFLDTNLSRYAEERNEPELDVASNLSPYLHFGHISTHEIFSEVTQRENWTPDKLSLRVNGSREGWWNMSATAEGFLDELITWREVGYNFSSHRDDYDKYDSLPDWAKKTLREHAKDQRDHLYTLEQFERGATHDPLWNAAQNQLVREGRIHNYLRMLWGKKILQWSETPQQAAEIMIHLNNKYGLDGRNPNSYSGIFWVLGRYDRPWAPVRPVFGSIRYMSSENTARKVSVKNYIQKYAPEPKAQKQLGF